MKLNVLRSFMVLLFAALLFSCDNNNPTFYEVLANSGELPVDEGGTEGAQVNAQFILENLIIEGSVISKEVGVNTGMSKIANSFDFMVPKYGFLKNGFPIDFKKGSAVPMAVYIQIKSKNGELSKGHTAFVMDMGIDSKKYNYVHFSDKIKAEYFCVVLYFLTVDGLTDPIEFCIEVPAWGGDHKVTGDWDIYYNHKIYAGGQTSLYKDTYTQYSETKITLECEGGGVINSFYGREKISASNFRIDSDGEAYFLFVHSAEILNKSETEKKCSEVWEVDEEEEDYVEEKGKWFFDKKKSVLYLVIFEDKGKGDDAFEIYKYGKLIRYKVFQEIKGLKLVKIEDEKVDGYEYNYGIRAN